MAERGIDTALIYECATDLLARQDERLWRINVIYLAYSVGLVLAGRFVLPGCGVPAFVAWGLGIVVAALWFTAVAATRREQKIRSEQLKELERNSQFFQYSQVDLRLFTTKYTLITRKKGFKMPTLFRQHWLLDGGLAIATFVVNGVLFIQEIFL